MVKQINEKEFVNETNVKGVILVDFYATWCPPCKAISPILDDIASSRKYKIFKVNIDESPNLTNRFKINTVPTLAIFKDGKLTEKYIGYMNKEEIVNFMDKHMEEE